MMSADVVRAISGFMASYVRTALDSDPALIARMHERGARVFVFECDSDDDMDGAIDRAIAAIDTTDTQLPIFIAELHLYRLSGRYGSSKNRRAFAVSPARGVFLGAIAIGEGGAVFLDSDAQLGSSSAALATVRALVG